MATGIFGGTITCAQAYVGAISHTPEERSSRITTMQAVQSIGYVCAPGIGGALCAVGAMVRPRRVSHTLLLMLSIHCVLR